MRGGHGAEQPESGRQGHRQEKPSEGLKSSGRREDSIREFEDEKMGDEMGYERAGNLKIGDDDSRAEQSRSSEDCDETGRGAGEAAGGGRAGGDKVRHEGRDEDDEFVVEKRWARPTTAAGDGRGHQGRWELPRPRQRGQSLAGRTWPRWEQAQWRVRRDATRSRWLHRKQQSSRDRGQEHRWSEAPQVSGEGKSWARVVSEGGRQIPGEIGFSGCWTCGGQHRAA